MKEAVYVCGLKMIIDGAVMKMCITWEGHC
jgi:hypothetical protein